MKGLRLSDSPRGVGMIANLEILCGIGCSVLGLIVLVSGIINGLPFIGYGVVIIAMGWTLDAMHSWAWWGNILTNVVLLLGTLIGMLMDFPSGSTTLFSNIISIALSAVITVYLLKPSVRSQFS